MNIRSSLALFALLFFIIGVKSSQGSSIVEDFISGCEGTIEKIYVKSGSYVKADQKILKLLSSKMPRITLRSFRGGYVANLEVQEQAKIKEGYKLFSISPNPPTPNTPIELPEEKKNNKEPLELKKSVLQLPIIQQLFVLMIPITPKVLLMPLAQENTQLLPAQFLPNVTEKLLQYDHTVEEPKITPSTPINETLVEDASALSIFHSVSLPMKHFAGRLPQLTPKDLGLQIFDGTFYHQLFWLTFEAFLLFLTLALSDVKGWELVWASRGFLRRSVAELREVFLFTPPSRRVLKISPSGSRRWTS
ncbi:biotin/lipoyl-containing protein [Candidatus Nucleicultrix amoebiphila]|jgi:hypothetical protein|uniref:Lipoyl-binding domain-containing protein n=1 Tax=Candidatus Nucleicultrix amoebiphila FS5 TaxID=1414854 RepID=A0A1W6N528_9PROT|nr:biotin/lipoyl-containing protein [Candidatus Nucleicultrix amoebiphila]ARN84974.1 hypothetical protein GQ61_06380 [Candidatus Nucleicultrix amoebiphila FS5]